MDTAPAAPAPGGNKGSRPRNRGKGRGRGSRGPDRSDNKRFQSNKEAQDRLAQEQEARSGVVAGVTIPNWIVDGMIPVVATGFVTFFRDYLIFLRSIARRPLIDYLNGDQFEEQRNRVFRALLTVFDLKLQLAQKAAHTKKPEYLYPFDMDAINNICDRVSLLPAPFQTLLAQFGNIVVAGQVLTPVYAVYNADNLRGLYIGSRESIRSFCRHSGRRLNYDARVMIDALRDSGYPNMEYRLVIDQPAIPPSEGVAEQFQQDHFELTAGTLAFWGGRDYIPELQYLCEFVVMLRAQNPKLVASFAVRETSGYPSQLVRLPAMPPNHAINAEAYAAIEITQSMAAIAGASLSGLEMNQERISWIQTDITQAPYRFSIPLFSCRRALLETVAP
jgi:hypothetical protein